MKQTLILS
jgi:Bromodomain